jgi:hypothetical protein
MIVIGIDPGARYTGVSVRDLADNTILLSSTYVKPEDTQIVSWAIELANTIKDEVLSAYPDAKIGIEGISDPKGYSNGKKSPINPKHIIRAGIVLGALAMMFQEAVIVPPGHNGSSRTGYPDVLNGRRPKDLPGSAKGAGTRNHEKSAYDVAGDVPFRIANNYKLDTPNCIE